MGDHAAADYAAAAERLPDALADAVARDLGIDGAEYLAEAAAAVDATDVVGALQRDGVDILGSRLDGTSLIVNVSDAAAAAAVEDAGGVAELGSPDETAYENLDLIPATGIDGGEGYVWQRTDGTASQCSIAITGRRVSDGAPVALTAGHCTGGMSNISGPVRVLAQTTPGTGGTWGDAIGSPAESTFGNGYDAGLITLNASTVTARAAVLTWGGGAGAPRSSATLPVEGIAPAIVGANLCKSGSRTGWTCGTVKSVDRSVNVGGTRVNSIIATTCIQPGDSGGAAMIGGFAVGVNSSTSSVACGSADYIAAFFPMVSAAGAPSVQSQFAGVWEPSLVLGTPLLDAISVPAGGEPGVLTGAVSRSAGARVQVFLDDATTPVASVPVVDGSYAVHLATLRGAPIGAHRLRIRIASGSWSTSSAAEAVLQFDGNPSTVSAGLLPSVSVGG